MTPHRHPLVKHVVAALRERCGVEPGDRLVVAVSGGADSVALLRALAVIAPRKEWSLDLHVAHVNHHLRDDAERDRDFVVEVAQGLELPVHVRDVRPGDAAGNLEQNARRSRYAALAAVAREVDAERVATAHHADDQLETLLMRVIRGASARGMSGIAWRRPLRDRDGRAASLIRPMLRVTHADAVAWLRDLGQPWREDATNADTARWRARLRVDVLPVLRDLRSDAAEKVTDTADRLRDAARHLDRTVRRVESRIVRGNEHPGRFTMPRDAARRLPRDVRMALIRRVLIRAGANADRLPARKIETIAKWTGDDRGGERTETFHNASVTVTANELRWSAGT